MTPKWKYLCFRCINEAWKDYQVVAEVSRGIAKCSLCRKTKMAHRVLSVIEIPRETA